MLAILKWLKTLFSGEPHFRIGSPESPYLLRWWLIPRNPWFNIYLHKFLRDDDDRALHDHPWWFVSLMISGGYVETRPLPSPYGTMEFERHAPSIAFRHPTDRHRVALFKDKEGKSLPCWTIVLTGRASRTWGFWCPKGFVPWHEFVDQDDKGNVGKGCGD